MPYLNNTIATLNQHLATTALSFLKPAEIKAYGIAETSFKMVDFDGSESPVKYPAMVSDDGEVTSIDIDDVYSLIMYHRVESIVNGVAAKGFGDSQGDPLETANMSLIVAGFRDKILKPAYMIEAFLKDTFPDARMTLKDQSGRFLQSSVFRVGNSNFDKMQLLEREFTQVELRYPTLIFFELKYRVDSTWKRGCIQSCYNTPLQS